MNEDPRLDDPFLTDGVLSRRAMAWLIDVLIIGVIACVAWVGCLLFGILTLGRSLFCVPLCSAAQRFYPEFSRQDKVGTLRPIIFEAMGRSNWLLSGTVVIVGALLSGGRVSSLSLVALLVIRTSG